MSHSHLSVHRLDPHRGRRQHRRGAPSPAAAEREHAPTRRRQRRPWRAVVLLGVGALVASFVGRRGLAEPAASPPQPSPVAAASLPQPSPVPVRGQVLAATATAPFARFPAISPDGATVAFSFQGDIWAVPTQGGAARRLTVHEAYEAWPRFSPDGSRIAFVSDRFGNDDIWVMDARHGTPRRLTYHSADDLLGGWTPDGRLLFETRRAWVQVEREREIWAVSVDGGTPDRLLDAVGYTPVMSPDGRFIVFAHGSNGEFRKGYRGAAAKNLWLYDTRDGSYRQLTDFDGNDMRPAFSGPRTLYFISERDGTYNLYRTTLGEDGAPVGEPVQLTRFVDDGVRTFDVNAAGTVVLERQTDLYVMPAGGAPRRLSIEVPLDERFDPVERRSFTDSAAEFAVSPDGRYVAFVVRGEIFLMRNDPNKNRTVRLTRHPYRDRDVAWADEHTLLFASDRDGQYELYLLRSADPDEPDLFFSLRHEAVRLTDTPAEEREPVVSPDGGKVAFRRGRGQLVVARLQDGALGDEQVLLDGWATPEGVAWSPDARWLAYALDDLEFNTEIYIRAADGSGEPVNVTQHPKADTSPVWSGDGSKLGFLSLRNNGDADVWFVWLRRADWEKTRADWELQEELPADGGDGGAGKQADGGGKTAPAPVQIDFERIYDRLVQVTSLPGNESDLAISPDGKTFYFVTNRPLRQSYEADQDLYSIRWDGTEMKALTRGGQAPTAVRLGPEGKRLYLLQRRGRLARVGTADGKLENLPFSARMQIDYRAEARQVFDEAWRVLDAGFYDPNFHGHDWRALGNKYRAWALRASTRRDFRDVFNMMLGELNASHLGMSVPDRAETQSEQTGLLGVEVDPVPEGVRVQRVIPDSPAARSDSRLQPDEVIVAVDGEVVAAADNFFALLADRADQRVVLRVRDSGGAEREVVIRPAASLRRQLYEEWVRDRRELTERYSGGRLGYIHVQGMNWPSFERFERELVASGQDKEGLVVDVRFNGGGWTTDYLMAVLTVRQHSYTIPRGAAADLARDHEEFRDFYPFGERLPLAAWTKPAAALCNANSFSNAEIFAHAFKTLGRGPLVGEPTFGAVISTGGAGLIDGSFVRLPFRGWFVRATDRNMENGPAVPDVIVPARPDDRAGGEDEQLRAAVRALLAQIDAGG